MTGAIKPAGHSGSRDQAQALLAEFPSDLAGCRIVLDCSELAVATPSFLDEIVKIVLVERGASGLDVINASERVGVLLGRAAQNRDVTDRVDVALRIP